MTTNTHTQPQGQEAPAGTGWHIPAIALRCSSRARWGHGHASLGDSTELLVPPSSRGCSRPCVPSPALLLPSYSGLSPPPRSISLRDASTRADPASAPLFLHIKKTQFRSNPLARRNPSVSGRSAPSHALHSFELPGKF